MIGVIPTPQARQMAMQSGLDLVEISPSAEPPVCRIMDFGKFRYEESRKEKESRRHQHGAVVKEIKFHANVAEHDYQTKIGHMRGFLEKGQRVKSALFFRGRENAHKEIGFELMKRVMKDCEDVCIVEMQPRLMGNNITLMLGPRSAVKTGGRPDGPAAAAAPRPAGAPVSSAPRPVAPQATAAPRIGPTVLPPAVVPPQG